MVAKQLKQPWGVGREWEFPSCVECEAFNSCMLERAIPECMSITSAT